MQQIGTDLENGRVIYDNIRKFIKYLLSCNSGEIGVMFLGPFLRMPLPLLPLQILWINLVTDGLPALALGVEPAEEDVMRRPPYASATGIFNRSMVRHIIWLGLFMAVIALAVGYLYWQSDQATWQTMVFTTLTPAQMFAALGVRSERTSLFKTGLLSNRSMLGAVALTFVLQLAVVYVPFFQSIFNTVALAGTDLALAIFLGFLVLVGIEIEKWFGRRGDRSEKSSQKGAAGG